MATIEDRPFSKNYSGLINQSVIAAGLFVICVASHEFMKKKRRGEYREGELGSVESWQFGYLYQARAWALKATPPIIQGWVLSWVKQSVQTPDHRMNELRGVDATLYVRFLQGCMWFSLAHTVTTFPILLPIHVTFSDPSVPSKSMTRASISSLVTSAKGASLLWIHLLLLIWVTASWMATLLWITKGAFRYRAQKIREAAERAAVRSESAFGQDTQYHPHPHPQYPFQALPPVASDHDRRNRGLRARTIMVTEIPPSLRSEKNLKEYFEYYMSRPVAKPSMGVTSAAQPGFIDRTLAFIFNKSIRLVSRMHRSVSHTSDVSDTVSPSPSDSKQSPKPETPVIDRVVLVHKLSELASLLERREEVLKNLETAHIKLARNALQAVAEHLAPSSKTDRILDAAGRISFGFASRARLDTNADLERGGNEERSTEGTEEGESRMHLLVRTLSPYLPVSQPAGQLRWSRWRQDRKALELQSPMTASSSQKSPAQRAEETVWDALLSLPRSMLDSYQPLIHLSKLFRGKTVPSIDYYTAKLNLLTSLITEKRAQPISSFTPMSTAFVTFADPADARRACKYLAVHPSNPVNVCLVTMAPSYEDLDWKRLMKSTFRVEFVKDWVVNIGVWAFTIFWVFPVTSIVGLVSIQTISAFWPGLKHYLDGHEWQSEVLQSLVPTLLVAILALLVPLILLLIAKKAHTISTLSVLHDKIMTRYYKFLIVNVLVFFCVGTATLQTLLTFKLTSGQALIQAVSESFPTAAPFYVGWLIFTTAMHGCLELSLFGLPLILYPSTQRQVTPRKRAVGIRPRTFNYYYWLPSHLLVLHILLLFAVLNPLIIPFGLIYFCVEAVVIKNQLLQVYAKNYEGNGQSILIRIIRYSMDGLILSQAVFLAYMVVLKRKANIGVAAVLIILTAISKLGLTRVCRARFERDDLMEGKILCGQSVDTSILDPDPTDSPVEHREEYPIEPSNSHSLKSKMNFLTWKFASRVGLSYGTVAHRRHHRRQPIPFGSRSSGDSSMPLQANSSTAGLLGKDPLDLAEHSCPILTNQPIVEEPSPMSDEGHIHLSLVVPHPPLPAWDDDSSPDTPYDNPYYVRQISDTLWLPRNPLSILNLDETVDMRISLTSDPSAGKLGAWAEEEFIGTALSSVFARSFSSLDETQEEHASAAPSRNLDGSEIITLSSGIASRVEQIDRSRDVHSPFPRRTSLVPRKSSVASTGIIPLRRRTLDAGPSSPGLRSFSLGTTPLTDPAQGGVSHLSVPQTHARQRSASVGVLGMQRQASSRRSPAASFLRPSSSSTAPMSVISTRDAVVGEAIAEEQEAAQQRQRKEDDEEEKAKEPRSWLTAWMFAKGQ